jgi:hypothetical protein
VRILLGSAVLLGTAAAALYLGVAGPRARSAAALAERYQRLREEHRTLGASLDRQNRTRQRAAALIRRSAETSTSLAAVRRRVLAALTDARLSGVRLSVASARPPAFASVKIEAEGRFLDLISLSARLAAVDAGLVLGRVVLSPSRRAAETSDGTRIAVEAFVLGGAT